MSCTKLHPVFTTAKIKTCSEIQPDIFKLELSYAVKQADSHSVLSGQFFMLRAEPSHTLLSRPISVYRVETTKTATSITFLILRKGQGTSELCKLRQDDEVSLIGPLGNTFPLLKAQESGTFKEVAGKVCVIGGGIGVAPVAGFASTLPYESYDFYACFKTGGYGLEHLKPATLTITTEDGSRGTRGMLPDVLTATELCREHYAAVYACGPEPMLAYVQKICKEAAIPCYLSMESRMACGMGACLGCTIQTTTGNKRCCKDGPVFPGETIVFPERNPVRIMAQTTKTTDTEQHASKPDLSVTIAGVHFDNPVIAASGTFGYGNEYAPILDVDRLGGICSKGLTLEARPGNTGIRLCETEAGLINSIGLENPGIPHFIANELPQMLVLKPVTIANLSGSTLETYAEGALLLSKTDVPMIELNISCPNVKAGGMAFGLQPEAAAEVTSAVRQAAPNKPLIVKLSPNAPDILAVADAVREAGANALSLVNTVQAMAIDIERGKPLFNNVRAGLSGPAIKPLALRLVYDLVQHINRLPEHERIPVIGLGGIKRWQDAVEFIMAGAAAVQVGTATFANPSCMIEIIDGIDSFMRRKGFLRLADFRGIAAQKQN